MDFKKVSIYLSYVLRHKPEDLQLDMDIRGWVPVLQLIGNMNKFTEYKITEDELIQIVEEDSKGRYRFNEDKSKIKACQGHSIEWIEPELEYIAPPEYLYHGTTTEALEKIMDSGSISKMSRHAVHMQASKDKAWQSATRWHKEPVILKIKAGLMCNVGYKFGKTENDVWCTESVPTSFIVEVIKNL